MPGLKEPIKIAAIYFESLHADDDGNVTLKFRVPPSECCKAGFFPLLRDVIFSAIFTPESVKDETTL